MGVRGGALTCVRPTKHADGYCRLNASHASPEPLCDCPIHASTSTAPPPPLADPSRPHVLHSEENVCCSSYHASPTPLGRCRATLPKTSVVTVIEPTTPKEAEDVEEGKRIEFVAGLLGGATGVLAGHPLDTVKVRLQMQEPGSKLYRGTWHCFTTIIRQEGARGLYKGITPPLTALSLINATSFGVHGIVSKHMDNPNSIQSHFLSGCAAGLAQSFISAPSERLKLLIQIQTDAAHSVYKSPRHAAACLIRQNGISTMFRGYYATVLRDCPAFGVYFASYDWMARKMSRDGTMESLHSWQLLLAGGGAGMASWLFNYPIDVVKTRFQACDTYASYWDCIKRTYAQGGMRSFYAGLNSTLIRAFPSNAVTFFTVEWTYRLFLNSHRHEEKKGPAPATGPALPAPINHSHKSRYIMMSDLWESRGHPILPEAGSTSIDPILHGSRFY